MVSHRLHTNQFLYMDILFVPRNVPKKKKGFTCQFLNIGIFYVKAQIFGFSGKNLKTWQCLSDITMGKSAVGEVW